MFVFVLQTSEASPDGFSLYWRTLWTFQREGSSEPVRRQSVRPICVQRSIGTANLIPLFGGQESLSAS